MSRLVGVALFLLPMRALGQESLVFVPMIDAPVDARPLPRGGTEIRGWYSMVFVRNFGQTASTVRVVPFFSPGCFFQNPLIPGAAVAICKNTRGPIDFVAIELGQDVALSAEMFRYSSRAHCGPSTTHEVVQLGGASLPVFKGLFPAGSTTVTNHINLGGRLLTPSCSDLPRELYPRRVNLTLANGGTQRSRFTVKFFALQGLAEPLSTQTFELDPREVRQFNAIQPTQIPYPYAYVLNSMFVWASVVSDQPYVGYLSSAFDDGGPDTMPLEVFPLQALR